MTRTLSLYRMVSLALVHASGYAPNACKCGNNRGNQWGAVTFEANDTTGYLIWQCKACGEHTGRTRRAILHGASARLGATETDRVVSQQREEFADALERRGFRRQDIDKRKTVRIS